MQPGPQSHSSPAQHDIAVEFLLWLLAHILQIIKNLDLGAAG